MPESKFNILYIDSSKAYLELFKSQFENDYNIITVEEPCEARKILKDSPIHLVISEQELPDTTGIEFFGSLNHPSPDLIKIIISDFRNAGQIIKALNAYQVHKYIIKPWDRQEIKETIEDPYKYTCRKRKIKKPY